MHLYSVTLRQKLGKVELADYFYGRILDLPGRFQLAEEAIRWYDQPVHLAVQSIEWGEDPQCMEGFTGIQFNLMPPERIDELVASLEETGQKVAAPRQIDDIRLIQVRDSSGNVLMMLGRDEAPDEPLIEQGVGSLSLFVSDLAQARRFYVDALGLAIRAEPHDGMLVLGETGTPLILYAAEANTQATPMGRRTGIAFADDDVAAALSRIEEAGGRTLDRATAPESEEIVAATVSDPDDNVLVVLAEAFLSQTPDPKPNPKG